MNEAGAIVGGARPAWYVDPPSQARSEPIAAPSSRPTTPSTDVGLVATDFSTYTSRFASGTVYVAGLIENQGTADAGVRTIAVSLFGANGETVGGAEAVYKPSVLRTGMRAGWLAVVSDVPSFKEVRIQVEPGPARSSFGPQITHDVRTEGVTMLAGRSNTRSKIAGQVVNGGDQETGHAVILAAVFSADGKILDVNQAYSKLETLGPGQSSPFEVTFVSEAAQAPARYELYAEARLKR